MFLYGSQNYGLDNNKSDLDFIMIVGHNDKMMIEYKTSVGVVKIFTLEHFINQLKFGDLRCYEVLYTKYKIINKLYEKCFAQFVRDFSMCMNYERIKFALRKKIDEHLCYVLWFLTNKEKARYSKKRLYWAIRSWNQLQRINYGESFKDSLIYKPLINYDLSCIKTITNYLSPKEFNDIYK